MKLLGFILPDVHFKMIWPLVLFLLWGMVDLKGARKNHGPTQSNKPAHQMGWGLGPSMGSGLCLKLTNYESPLLTKQCKYANSWHFHPMRLL